MLKGQTKKKKERKKKIKRMERKINYYNGWLHIDRKCTEIYNHTAHVLSQLVTINVQK